MTKVSKQSKNRIIRRLRRPGFHQVGWVAVHI